jgi:hypothetical protein
LKKVLAQSAAICTVSLPARRTFSTSVPEGMVGRSASSLESGLVGDFSEKTSEKELTSAV